jgi:outer membrane protein assembly factor BamA
MHFIRCCLITTVFYGISITAEEIDCTNTFNAKNSLPHSQDIHLQNNVAQEKNTVKAINIHILPVFDETNPEENNWLFHLVNELHIDTHHNVIKNDLLFAEGEHIDTTLLEESERILRSRRYLNSALVSMQSNCNNEKTVDVSVHEVWTLVPEITYSHTGGNSNYGFGLHDSNFLGLGKTVNISHSVTALRTGDTWEYYDPNIGYLNSTLKLHYEDNDDGHVNNIALMKPFVALTTDWAGGINYLTYSQEVALYNAGKEADRFGQESNNHSIFYGVKLASTHAEFIHRITLGYNNFEDIFYSIGTPPNNSTVMPAARQFSYPWVEYQHIHDGYIEAYNIQQINRIEDINLGAQIKLRLGYVASKFDSYNKSLAFEAEYAQGKKISNDQLVRATISSTGFYGNNQFYNSLLKGDVNYHWKNLKRGQLYVGITHAKGFQLFQDLPIELGGDTGLRGYPIRYQAGDRLSLLTIEQRFFGEKEWLSLFHLGAAFFYDQGRVNGASAIPQDQQGWLRDVGFGIRISGTRNGNMEEGSHNVLHIDIASPLDGSSDISKLQWLVKVKNSF